MLALPGGAYLYQGEELGLDEVDDLPEAVLRDPTWERSGRTRRGRDGCRVPLPWCGDEPPFGFSTGDPWLPQPARWADRTVGAQDDDPRSMLNLYRAALRIRAAHPAFGDGCLSWLDSCPEVLAFRREPGVVCVVNLGPEPVPLPPHRTVLLSSDEPADELPTDAAVWLAI